MWWLDENSWLPRWVDATTDDEQRLKMDTAPDDHKEMDTIDLTIAVCAWYTDNICSFMCMGVCTCIRGMPREHYCNEYGTLRVVVYKLQGFPNSMWVT